MGILPFDPVAARNALNIDPNATGSINMEASNKVVAGAEDIMNHGISGVHVHYVFGGNDPFTGRLDCSSFTHYVYQVYAGMEIGRTTGEQVTKGAQINKQDMVPGDLVFFKGTYNSPHIYGVSHVGIYVGNNQFINNSSGANGIVISDLTLPYWQDHWLMARRVLSTAQLQPDSSSTPSGSGVTFQATAYGANPLNLMGGKGWVATGKTATGTTPVEGRTVAVDKTVIPLYSKIRIESDYPGITGDNYIAEDVGGAIKGNKIDIYFDDSKDPEAARKRMQNFGRRDVKVTVLRKGKG
jgi:3D (Asp-Asp-Asp) domain-containing protein